METTTVKNPVAGAVQAAENAKTKINETDIFRSLIGDYEFKRYGIVPILLLWNVCLGGIGVAVGALESAPMLVALSFSTMAVLVMILSVQPMKLTLRIALFATIVDLVVIFTCLLS